MRIDSGARPLSPAENHPSPPKPRPAAEKPAEPESYFSHDQFHATRSLGHYSKSTGGEVYPVELTGQRELVSGSFSKGGSLYEASGTWGTPGSSHFAAGDVQFGSAEVHGNGAVTGSLRNLSLGAHASVGGSAYLVNAQGIFTSNYGIGSTTASGYAQVGADADATADVAIDPLHGNLAADIDAGAFAGARAGEEIQETVGPIGVDESASVEAGIGAHFNADVGFHHGKFSAKLDIGACLGIGASFKIGFSFDAGKLAHEVGSLAKGAVHGLSSAAHAVGHAVGSAAHAVGHAISGAAHAIGHLFKGW